MFVAAVVRTWSYCGSPGLGPVSSGRTFGSGMSTVGEIPTNDYEAGTVVETMAGLKTPPLSVMSPAQVASALLSKVQAEAQKGP
jgi:hypothetical protein